MITPVSLVVGAARHGTGPVVPYSHANGLQFYVSAGVRTNRPVVYTVPLYDVTITGGGTYLAVRFGLQNHETPPTATRPCDAGLSQHRVCTPGWLPSYSPHSFRGGSRPGAWQLLPGKGFLIHEGANRALGQVGGSLGCIEILDGRWNDFLAEIESVGKGTCAQIGAALKLKVTIETTTYPVATLR